jgi:hypothetical protein
MDASIISRNMIAGKARSAFVRGAGRDDHGFNWHSAEAIAAWQAEWDRCQEAFTASLEQAAEVSPP